uniref:helix-turn-helix domain-containing protein n=1 Tax=Paractinoplanes polyasparticus TaxID=2856853 RepID=UPI001C864AB6|nr:helix-turn-helix transcriptional regulator [Actinoplanes polyasparticus]
MPKDTTAEPAGVEIDGVKLRIKRKYSGRTMADLAAQCGVHVTHVSLLERGKRNPSPPLFVRLCDALAIPADERYTLLTKDAQRRVKAAA